MVLVRRTRPRLHPLGLIMPGRSLASSAVFPPSHLDLPEIPPEETGRVFVERSGVGARLERGVPCAETERLQKRKEKK